jgi:AraC-like DNA-binding protein
MGHWPEQREVDAGIARLIRRRLMLDADMFPAMPTVATEFGMSTRTLRNRLVRESTSYRALVDEVREELAEQLLAANLSVDAIAERLGYNDTSSFITAFKRWKGIPPRRYRDQLFAGAERAEQSRA